VPKKPAKRRARGPHPNLVAWLRDAWPLPVPEEALELMLDPSPPDQYKKLWAQYRPGEDFIEPWRWYNQKIKRIHDIHKVNSLS